MALNIGGVTMSEVGNRISSPGRIVQTVHTTFTNATDVSNNTATDLFTSSSITLTSASNKVLIEFHCDVRADVSDGAWNLFYMDLQHVQTSTQLDFSGYRGENTYSIRHFHKRAIHTPGSTGPHSYKVRGWNYPTTSLVAHFNSSANISHDGTAYITLMEIAV